MPGRAERAAASRSRAFLRAVLRLEGVPRWLCASAFLVCAVASAAWIALDIAAWRGPLLDTSWENYGRVACVWLALSLSLILFSALVDVRLPGIDVDAERFVEYPLFSWVAPTLTMMCWYAPAAVYLTAAWYFAMGDTRCTSRPAFEGSLVAHTLAGMTGFQLRELVYLRCDNLMLSHHCGSVTLTTLAWRRLRAHPEDCQWALATAAAVAVMDAASAGHNLFLLAGGGARLRALFAVAFTGSHAVVLLLGIIGHLARHPDGWESWVMTGGSLIFAALRQRHMHLATEADRDSGTGAAGDLPPKQDKGD